MPMMRLKAEAYEKLEEMAVSETARRKRIVPVSELMHELISVSYQDFKENRKNFVKRLE